MLTEKEKYLFVCKGNRFRSLAAEYCLKDFIRKEKIEDVVVDSAGTGVQKGNQVDLKVLEALSNLNIDARMHIPTLLTRQHLQSYKLVIGISQPNIEFMKEKFDYTSALLFNQVVKNEKSSILDIDDIPELNMGDPDKMSAGREKHIRETIRYIYVSTPLLYRNLHQHINGINESIKARAQSV